MPGNSSDAESRPRCAEGEGEEGVEEEEEEKRGEEEGEKKLLIGAGQDEDILFRLNVQEQEDGIDLYQRCCGIPSSPLPSSLQGKTGGSLM